MAEESTKETPKKEETTATPAATTDSGLDPKLAALLAYLFSIVGGVLFLLISKDKFVRFHAMQSTMLSIAFFVLSMVMGFIPIIGWVIAFFLPLGYLILTILLMVKAYNGEKYKLPYIGDMAEKNI